MTNSDRFERLFSDAEDRLREELERLFADHAASGRLQSGLTIKRSVAALDKTTRAAVTKALDGIAAVTEHSGSERRRLLTTLDSFIDAHLARAEEIVRNRIEGIRLGSDFRHARPFIDKAAKNQHILVSDFREGWTAPASKPWNERHPVYFAIIIAVIGAALGAIATGLVTK
jgi:hypothetical protein